MSPIRDLLAQLWYALAVPHETSIGEQIKWVLIALLGAVILGSWIGQFVLPKADVYYPKERFALAVAWSLVAYAVFLAVILLSGWWFVGSGTWRAVIVHAVTFLAVLVTARVLVPTRPATPKTAKG